VTPFSQNLISLILNILSRYLITRIGLLVVLPSNFIRFSGVITLRMKRLGKKKSF